MRNQAYINEKDIYSTFGASLVKGAYEALLTPAPVKQYVTSNSRLTHGEVVIATAETTKLQPRNLTINILIEGTTQSEYLSHYSAFLAELTKGEFVLKVPKLNAKYRLVYIDCKKYGDYGQKKGIFALNLREPNPTDRQL